MTFKFEKNAKILFYIAAYCHSIGAIDYHMDLRSENGVSELVVSSHVPDLPDKVMNELRRELNLPRQKEVEQSFWVLTADSSSGNELSLVGMMVDTAEIWYADGVLTIRATRLED